MKSGLYPEKNERCFAEPSADLVLSIHAINSWLKYKNAAKHLHTQTYAHILSTLPLLPASLLMVLSDPWPCLSFFLSRPYIQQPTHPTHCASPVPAADHLCSSSLVHPQVKTHPPYLTPSPCPRWLAGSQTLRQSSGWQTLPPLVIEAEPCQEVLLVDSLSCLSEWEQKRRWQWTYTDSRKKLRLNFEPYSD